MIPWWARHVAAMPGVKSAVILARSAAKRDRVRSSFIRSDAEVLVVRHRSIARCVAAYARVVGKECAQPLELHIPRELQAQLRIEW